MSEPRKDVRSKLDAHWHAGLKLLCRIEGVTELEFIESLLVPEIRERINSAAQIAAEATLEGLTGIFEAAPGRAGRAGR